MGTISALQKILKVYAFKFYVPCRIQMSEGVRSSDTGDDLASLARLRELALELGRHEALISKLRGSHTEG